jgi:hypothetical protein
MNIITAHPKLEPFGIGLAITFVIGAAIGVLDNHIVAFTTNGHYHCFDGSPGCWMANKELASTARVNPIFSFYSSDYEFFTTCL